MHDIRGEYWIIDGHVDFADGDIGDKNHEAIANDYIFNHFSTNVSNLAEELGIEDDTESYGEVDPEKVTTILNNIIELLMTDKGMNEQGANAYVMKELQADQEAFVILMGGGDPRFYVIKHWGWIAVRSNNVEIFGYDTSRQKQIAEGIRDILYEEGGHEEPEIEVAIYDFKTGKSWYASLAELEQPHVTPNVNQQVTTTYNKSFYHGTNPKDEEENKYATQAKSGVNQLNQAAQKQGMVGPGQQLWRGTSESFRSWLESNESIDPLDRELPNAFSERLGRKPETLRDYLIRHKITINPDGTVVLYHARPKNSKYTFLRAGSYLTSDPEAAKHFAARDRDLDSNKDIELLTLNLPADYIAPAGHIILLKDFPLNNAIRS